MGVDITLGVLVLLCAVRGWFKGFLRQAIPLGALVGCVYLADPVRDLARPHALKSFPSIGPEVMDRLLWWSGAAVSYLIVAGIGLSIAKSMRKRTYGDPEPNRADQGAGFTLGVAKGVVAASFLAWALGESKNSYVESAPYIAEQASQSRAMEWSNRYQPAKAIWASAPIQNFVNRVKSRGIHPVSPADHQIPTPRPEVETARPSAASDPLRTASGRLKTLSLPRLDPDSPEFVDQIESEMKKLGLKLD